MAEVEHQQDVVKFFTRARRIPQEVGRTHTGEKIPGGPYPIVPFVAAGVVFGVGYKLFELSISSGWRPWALVIGVAAAAGLVAAKLDADGRSPVTVVAGLVSAISAPSEGRCGGARVRQRRARVASTQILVALPAHDQGVDRPSVEDQAPAAAQDRPVVSRRAVPVPVPASPAPQVKAAPLRVAGRTRQLTGVEQLLAGLPTSTTDRGEH